MLDVADPNGPLRDFGRPVAPPKRSLRPRSRRSGPLGGGPLVEMAADHQLDYAGEGRPKLGTSLHAIELLGELGEPRRSSRSCRCSPGARRLARRGLTQGSGRNGRPAVGRWGAWSFERTERAGPRDGAVAG